MEESATSCNTPHVIFYYPINIIVISGASKGLIRFTNAEIGEFSYAIQLIAHDAKPKKLEMIHCPLGTSKVISCLKNLKIERSY